MIHLKIVFTKRALNSFFFSTSSIHDSFIAIFFSFFLSKARQRDLARFKTRHSELIYRTKYSCLFILRADDKLLSSFVRCRQLVVHVVVVIFFFYGDDDELVQNHK